MTDWRALLKKYMDNVAKREGVYLLGEMDLTDDEQAAFTEIIDEIAAEWEAAHPEIVAEREARAAAPRSSGLFELLLDQSLRRRKTR